MRELIEKNGKFIAPAILLLAIVVIGYGLSSGRSATDALGRDKWMFDLGSGTLVREAASTAAPSGSETFDFGPFGQAGAVVDAVVYSCGDPGQVKGAMTLQELAEVDAHVGYLRVDGFPGEAPQVDVSDSEEGVNRRLVSAVDGARWVPEFSGEGRAIQGRVAGLCGDKLPVEALP